MAAFRRFEDARAYARFRKWAAMERLVLGASKAEVAKYKRLILERVAREQAEAGRGESPREGDERVDLETRAQPGSARRGRSGNR